jgi:hypothetical protein
MGESGELFFNGIPLLEDCQEPGQKMSAYGLKVKGDDVLENLRIIPSLDKSPSIMI